MRRISEAPICWSANSWGCLGVQESADVAPMHSQARSEGASAWRAGAPSAPHAPGPPAHSFNAGSSQRAFAGMHSDAHVPAMAPMQPLRPALHPNIGVRDTCNHALKRFAVFTKFEKLRAASFAFLQGRQSGMHAFSSAVEPARQQESGQPQNGEMQNAYSEHAGAHGQLQNLQGGYC